MYRLIAAVLLFVTATVSASAQSLPIPSYWQNQRGSELNVIPAVTPCLGCFGGFYWNHAAGFQCQASPANPKPYTVTGYTRGPYLRFKVIWDNGIQNCHSTTLWQGYVQGDTMRTSWLLT